MTAKAVIAISTSSFGKVDQAPLVALREAGFEPRLNPHGRKLSEAEAKAHVEGAVGLIAGTEPLTGSVMDRAPSLRAISRVGAGMDNVDHEAAAARGIEVRNTPNAHVDAVAELALGAILAGLRQTGTADRSARAGRWDKPMGRLLRGLTVGIVGLGRVGRALVELLAPFGVTLLAADPARDDDYAAAKGIRYVALEDLVAASDVVTLHVPFSAGVEHLIGAKELAAMKPDALLVNTARGGLVDETALLGHLREHPGAYACLDCFEQEPYTGPLSSLDNILVTTHIGSYAREVRVRMETEAVHNLLAILRQD